MERPSSAGSTRRRRRSKRSRPSTARSRCVAGCPRASSARQSTPRERRLLQGAFRLFALLYDDALVSIPTRRDVSRLQLTPCLAFDIHPLDRSFPQENELTASIVGSCVGGTVAAVLTHPVDTAKVRSPYTGPHTTAFAW
eukprot:31543-Pelagococcus_subviridis.AAC.15